MHNASLVQLGQVPSSAKNIMCFNSDPATFLAGLAVRQSSTVGVLSLAKADGELLGVSVGASLSDTKKTSVVTDGLDVPLRAHLKRATGLITISSYANLVSGTDDSITIAGVEFTAQAGAVTPGDPTFQAATSDEDTATSLADQINANETASAKVYAIASADTVRLYSVVEGVGGTGTGNDIAVSYTDNDSNVGITLSGLTDGKLAGGSDTISDIDYMTKGSKVYINDATGKADVAMTGFSTITDATYVTGPLTGNTEDNSSVPACQVWMQGGL